MIWLVVVVLVLGLFGIIYTLEQIGQILLKIQIALEKIAEGS